VADAPPITVYVRSGDPDSVAMLRHLDQRGYTYRARDVLSDPSASAVLFGRLGRVVVPALEVGGRMLVGYDPVQLARFLPRLGAEEAAPSFGAAVRTVSPDVARERGLPAVYGVEVGRVAEGSPAADAGLLPGDLITQIGAYTLNGGAEQFRNAVAVRRPGDSMVLGVRRDGQDLTMTATFPQPAEEPDGPSA
jgi:membrane-associated protease RseP (regulator of RpoE activity)